MFDGPEYSSGSECLAEVDTISKRKRNCRNKRRFSDEQIRSLEVMFESDTKLEPRKKAQLAKDLGLHPRQIAIWFQNRRARWKSKQIEKDYTVLLANYNTLASQFESLKKENQSLSVQLEKLKKDTEGQSSSDGESDNTKIDFQVKNVGVLSDEDSSIKAELLALDEENELLKMAVDSSLTSSEDWGSLDSDDLITQPSQTYQWWDFWG